MNDDRFKMITRRYLAWGAIGVAMGTCSFVAIWSIVCKSGCQELGSLALGILGTSVGTIIGFYFSKKMKEE